MFLVSEMLWSRLWCAGFVIGVGRVAERSTRSTQNAMGAIPCGFESHLAQINMIIFTRHAKDKFEILKRHKFLITEKQVIETVEKPDLIDESRLPLLIAQRKIDRNYVLRVAYKREFGIIKVITFYPGRIKQYNEKK